jgi:hypothetical protein
MITLEYNLKQGEILKQNMVMNMDMVQKFGGQEIKISIAMKMKMAFEVKESQNDSYTMEVKFKEMIATVGVPGMQNISFDSNTSEDVATQANIGPIFKAIIDKPFETVMTKTGKVRSVKGLDKFMEAMLGAFGEDVPEETRRQMIEQFGSQFSEEALKSQLEQSTGYFPDKPVGIGDTWNTKVATKSSNFTINIEIKSTLKSIEDNVVGLAIDGIVSTPEGYEMDINGAKAKASLKGSQKGTFKLNKDTGWVISSDMIMNFNGDIEVMGMKVPVYVASTIQITNE